MHAPHLAIARVLQDLILINGFLGVDILLYFGAQIAGLGLKLGQLGIGLLGRERLAEVGVNVAVVAVRVQASDDALAIGSDPVGSDIEEEGCAFRSFSRDSGPPPGADEPQTSLS